MTSKYDRLADLLATFGDAEITLTFAQVEAVVGPLPAAVRRSNYGDWWGIRPNARYHAAHAMHWWRAGYVADRLDFIAGTVTFRRVTHAS